MSTNIKLYHWQTTSYAQHKATDDLLTSILPLIDTFIEVYMGRYQRPKFSNDFNILVEELTTDSLIRLINEYISFLKKDVPTYLKSSDTDILNIRDEMLANFNKTLYLLTLN
jgi:hypothetical protein